MGVVVGPSSGPTPRGILEGAALAVFLLDDRGKIVGTLGDAYALTGLDDARLIGHTPAEVLQRAPAGKTDLRQIEERMARGTASPHAALVAIDVAAHARIDAAALEHERETRLMFRQVPVATWATDRELRITHWLGRVEHRLGIPEPTIVGMTVQQFARTPDPADPAVLHHLEALRGKSASFRYQLRDRWYEIHVDPLRDEAGVIIGCVAAALDVTDRTAAEQRLVASEALLAQSQQLAHVGSWQWDFGRGSMTWSDELYRICGLDRATFVPSYKGLCDRIISADLPRFEAVVSSALRSSGPFALQLQIARPDGMRRTLHTSVIVIADEAQRPVKMIGACLDLTEWADTQRKLERSISLLEATIESTADGILVVDLAGNVVALNRRFSLLWNIPLELAERRDERALLAYVLDQLEEPEVFLRGVRALYSCPDEERLDVLRFKDGRVFERYSRPQRVEGVVAGRVWSFRDVSERERLLRHAVFLADAGRLLTTLDADQALESVAQLAVPVVGDACAVDLVDLGIPRRIVAVARNPSVPAPSQPSLQVLAGGSHLRETEVANEIAVPILAVGRVVGVITVVVTAPRRFTRVELELVEEVARRGAVALENTRLYRAAREEVKAREEFLAVAAHEIRGPVASIRLAVQALDKQLAPASKLIGVIEREERRLTQLVDELLDVGRMQAGKLQFVFEPVDLGALVREIGARMASELARAGSTLTIRTEGSTIGSWDRLRLDQAVVNLLTNAIKFGLGRPIEISVTGTERSVVLEVTDQGVGIRRDMQRLIFEPFERAVPARHYGGLGLGLYIVRTIVTGLGGKLTLRSEEGAGSTFTIVLPRQGVPA
ncbi:MAG: ATP-binding protein [Kofleriaceae bacterium]|nr:ATP-binding protein [Kofleriaceae bacterium]